MERNINICLKKYFFKFLITCVQIAGFATKMTEKHFTKVAKSGKIINVACWFTVCVGGVLVRKTIFRREGWGRAICICIKILGGLICCQGHTKKYPLPPNAFGTFPYNYKLNQI